MAGYLGFARRDVGMVGAYDGKNGALSGFARAFSDGAAHACLADVFVLGPARGRGWGRSSSA